MKEEKTKVLFVCMGNICRSPSAQGAFAACVEKRGISALFEIDSAGTHAHFAGDAADSRAQLSAKKLGVDLSSQRARQIKQNDFYYFDYIIAMDMSNLTHLQAICPAEQQHKLSLILDNLPKNQIKNVPDPYLQGRFDEVFALIAHACDLLLQKILAKT